MNIEPFNQQAGWEVCESSGFKFLLFPEELSAENKEYYQLLEEVINALPEHSIGIKWLGAEKKTSPFLCQILIFDETKRGAILSTLDEVLLRPGAAIEGYVVTVKSICVCPLTEDGSEIGQSLVTIDG